MKFNEIQLSFFHITGKFNHDFTLQKQKRKNDDEVKEENFYVTLNKRQNCLN